MNFKEFVELYRNPVYSKICEYLPIKEPEEHYKIVRDYSDRQGSYRRPGLLMLSGMMFGAKPEELLLPAAAMQLSEDWILVHDDVEDHSVMRRGKPTLHLLYGMEIAINAGDGAHMAMWKMLKDYMMVSPKSKGGRLYDKFYHMLQHTVEGQYLDDNFIYNVKDLSKGSESIYYRIIEGKTCYYTVYGPIQLGAIVAGQGDRMLRLLEKITKPAGLAFQIVDDILDMTADEKHFGKQKYGDIYEGKLTLIIHDAYKKANESEKRMLDSVYAKKREDKSESDIASVVEIVNKYNSIDYARELVLKYQKQTQEGISKNRERLPKNEYTDIMLTAMEELAMRSK